MSNIMLTLFIKSYSCALYSSCREQKEKKKKKREDELENVNMALQVVKDTAIAFIVQGALDATKCCLQIGVDLFRGAKNRLEKY